MGKGGVARGLMSNPILSSETIPEALSKRFQQLHGTRPKIFRAPGRVNLIGEHTDYNDGYVMPIAIELYTWVAAGRRDDRILRVQSLHFGETMELPLDELAGSPRQHWSDYIRGVAAVLGAGGRKLSGANLVIHGQLPLGGGLSSSASLEISTALALMWASNFELPPLEMVRACQRAEHEYAGTRCGMMDQFVTTFARLQHALMLDCRSLEYRLLPIPLDARVVVANSMVRHELAVGEYNRRRADCEAGVSILRRHLPSVRALRDVTPANLESHKGDLPDPVYRRCRHVISENQRVLAAAEALQVGDLDRVGQFMYESHRSLRSDYEVSSTELDVLVELASACQGVYGARLTGGGFGGCTVNLVRSEAVERLQARIAEGYARATGIIPALYVCSAAEGAGAS
ncbi:MAG TPA: galactokinase [Terriglobales bacterium]|nr:galactokinase [Terriglobales bacterium]